jgi:hypothetical protein
MRGKFLTAATVIERVLSRAQAQEAEVGGLRGGRTEVKFELTSN